MKNKLNDFLSNIKDFNNLKPRYQVNYFVYFLTIVEESKGVWPSNVQECFKLTDLHVYSYIAQYLNIRSKLLKNQKPIFIRDRHGYHLERSHKIEIEKKLGLEKIKREVSKTLVDLLPKITDENERDFLHEAIKCYEIGAYRAVIILIWILILDHLYEYILSNELKSFNNELAKVKDKRVKISVIKKKDDFTEIPESNFIQICRSAKIITISVRDILVEKLKIRNSCAHASGIKILQGKASDFIEDLVNNVVLKYKI